MRERKIDNVREILGCRDVTVERTEEIVYERSAWSGLGSILGGCFAQG